MQNPLLQQGPLPSFSNIVPEKDIEPAIQEILGHNRKALTTLLATHTAFTWDNLMRPLEDMSDRLSKAWTPVAHLHGVAESDPLRTAYNACLPLLTEYHTEVMQNESLYQAVKSIADSKLDAGQQKVIQNELRDFRLAGVHLPPDEKIRFGDLQKKLSQLTTKFSENVLDATHHWTLHITDANALKGMPPSDLETAAETAKQQNKSGWVLTLEYPCFSAAMKFLENRELRQRIYEAYSTRASDQGPDAGRFDNSSIMDEILGARHELATLLGFANYAEYSLATKMAHTPTLVMDFLTDLVHKSKSAAEKEMQELTEFAKTLGHTEQLASWDIGFYSEKLRQQKYAVSQEELKVYFPAAKVLEGFFTVVSQLYSIRIVPKSGVDTWHPQVNFYEIYDEKNQLRGGIYIDLYARPHKRDGAWMDEARVRRHLSDGSIQNPVAFLTCNFSRPLDNKPSLLTHDEVETLFHEFGHCLHHVLTRMDYAAISGINGVPWDAVEFPSQIMEHWCWEKEVIKLISGHYETGEPLPDTLYNKLVAAKNFQSGMQMMRQLEFALFDFRLHLEYDPAKGGRVQALLDDVRKEAAVVKYPAFNRFQNSFSHIFAGGYAAGYYSYKWAEVLSSDAYSLFEETGVLNPETGKSYLKNILEQGGSRDPMDMFIAFRGREPRIEALLRHSGLLAADA
jgi:oligopeptidase A